MGANVLYAELIRCELVDGVVAIEMASGEHHERGSVPLRVAMQLYLRLGLIFQGELPRPTCFKCGAPGVN